MVPVGLLLNCQQMTPYLFTSFSSALAGATRSYTISSDNVLVQMYHATSAAPDGASIINTVWI